MDIRKFMSDFAKEIDGDYSEYDNERSVIVVKLPDERFQTVIGRTSKSEKYNRDVIELTSKVCDVDHDIDYQNVLSESAEFIHSRFIVADDSLKISSVHFTDNASETEMKEIILEVAAVADEWEKRITGQDVN